MVWYIQLHGAFVLHQTGCAHLEIVHIVAVAASHEDLDVSTTLTPQDHGKQLPNLDPSRLSRRLYRPLDSVRLRLAMTNSSDPVWRTASGRWVSAARISH